MTHVSLYRRFRPSSWDKVIGQDHIVTTLVNQIKSGAVSHAYLFTGTRGTGKTSTAKIFAKAVNCLDPKDGSPCGVCANCKALASPNCMDVIEMDAASNNRVEEIRELRENVQYPPAEVKYKVYIIDEVHMLSGSAFNALLKTLEEPPKHVIFILATTEVHKLPETILSRCLRFDFRLVPKEKLAALLAGIFSELKYEYEPEALEILASHGEGSVRDTLSIADMCMSFSPKKLTADAVLEVLGASDFSTLYEIAEGVLTGNTGAVLSATNKVYSRGKGITTFNRDLGAFFRDLVAIKNVPAYRAAYNEEQYRQLKGLAERFDNYRLGRVMDIISSAENLVRYSTQQQIVLDACLIKAAEMQTEPNIEALISRVRALENRIKELEQNGIKVAPAASPSAASSAPSQSKVPEPPAQSIAEVLESVAVKVEEAPIFEDAPEEEAPELDSLSKAAMSGLLTAVREEGFVILYRSLAMQEDYILKDKKLIINVPDNAGWSILTRNQNDKLLDGLIKKTMGEDYGVEIIQKITKARSQRESKKAIKDLFGTKLIDKTGQ
ncbi:MAG TPA: DNA polymerase III subunit gamma/tau [Clostridia bacterium]|nr:DNA polymerase III subunit gamma/tau [Clostridia bacterium]HOL60643.1 DNA polymerase III subunit gamma/tau [Clostridia bacterium]HPO53050.1 DNA polymerase III subunit gamma/tau [Clostridia bacterium]